MIVHFTVRRQAAAEYGHRSRGGPVTVFAQALHAHLFGLPDDPDPLPTAIDALLQATHTASSKDQQAAILQRLAEQLRNAAEIIQRYQYKAQWDRLPDSVAEQLREAHTHIKQVTDTLDHAATAFHNSALPAGTEHSTAVRQNDGRLVASPAPPTTPAPRRRL
ncbi:hypothetical protein [Streptomyces sp. NPDC059076]|uniref:hypothetical protein n=1 Tax=unclassified Streptomyces TaxID=2593676 RepID=UPI0036C84FB4